MWEKLYLFECHSHSGQTERQECFRWLNVSITNRMREGIFPFEFHSSYHYLVAYTFSFSISWGYIPIVCFHVEHHMRTHFAYSRICYHPCSALVNIPSSPHANALYYSQYKTFVFFSLCSLTFYWLCDVRCSLHGIWMRMRLTCSFFPTSCHIPKIAFANYCRLCCHAYEFLVLPQFFFLRRNYLFLWGFNFTFFVY